MFNQLVALVIGFAVSGVAIAQEANLHFIGDFESGEIKSVGSTRDGFYIATLPDPQSGGESLTTGQSDFGPASDADTKVVRDEVVGGETVKPRKGQYFLRSQVYQSKNYLDLNDNVKNRPRSKIYMSDAGHQIEFDQEGFAGFSIYVPRNFENELGIKDHRGDAMLFVMSSDSSRTLFNLGVWVEAPDSEAHWFVRTWTSETSTNEDGAKLQLIDLGPVSADQGKWTDFVVRYRFNPFTVDTNPAAKGISSAKDQQYPANKGVLQIWKSEGSVEQDGNREMVLKVDKVNTPVGLVPHATDKIAHRWRVYKYGWTSNPTTLTHPVWFGFDEIRQGLVGRDGTTFADVAPSGVPCTADCGNAELEKPRPPTSLTIE